MRRTSVEAAVSVEPGAPGRAPPPEPATGPSVVGAVAAPSDPLAPVDGVEPSDPAGVDPEGGADDGESVDLGQPAGGCGVDGDPSEDPAVGRWLGGAVGPAGAADGLVRPAPITTRRLQVTALMRGRPWHAVDTVVMGSPRFGALITSGCNLRVGISSL